jgi:hypothetical protein
MYWIMYNNWDGYYAVHTPQGEVRFYKDEQGLPYIHLAKLSKEAVVMLLQKHGVHNEEEITAAPKEGASFVQTVQGNYEGFTKKEILQAKKA